MHKQLKCLVRRMEGDLFVITATESIPLGAVFTHLAKERLDGESPNFTHVDLGVVDGLMLTVNEIRWPHMQIASEVPNGHSAGIKFEGDGFEVLKASLATLNPREFLSLQ